jgi:hypothetical protein
MRRFRFSLRALVVAITLISLALGYLVWQSQRMKRFAAKRDEAVVELGKAFEILPDGFESCVVPWAAQTAKDFDKAEYEFWMTEARSEPRLGTYQAGYFRAKFTNGDQNLADVERLALKHFSDSLQPLGFKATERRRVTLSHGTRTLFILVDPETPVEADITIVDGPKGFMYISTDVGAK